MVNDPITLSVVLLLFLERVFSILSKVKKSKCCRSEVEFNQSQSPENSSSNLNLENQSLPSEVQSRISLNPLKWFGQK